MAPCQAQSPSRWTAEVASDRAWTTYNGFDAVWTSERVQVGRTVPEKNGWYGGLERQSRYGFVDVAAFTRAFWHVGGSTLLVGGAATHDATFLYRASVETEFSRRLVRSTVASAGYRYLGFRSVDIHQLQPALTWYHSRGEVGGRVFLSYNAGFRRTSPTALVRAVYDVGPRVRVSGAVSYGDRIFDVASLPTGSARAHLGVASVRLGVTRHDAVDVGVSFAHEAPAFDYRSLSVGYRRLF